MNASDSPASIYANMQAAVDIVGTSPHPSNKIAATIAGPGFAISRTNHWPEIIAQKIGTGVDIGNSSGTIHAETACILDAAAQGHATKGASIFITDPPCPNCMKNMAEAGIAKLYIDHKGFDKDWARRRGESFETMSMRIAAKAGMDVYVIYRKEQKFEIISQHPPGYKPAIENPAIIVPLSSSPRTRGSLAQNDKIPGQAGDDALWNELINDASAESENEPFVLALGQNKEGKDVSVLIYRHPTIGYTYETMESKDEKYSFILQPLGRILMVAAREGIKLNNDYIYSSRVPTSRELVNFIGAGLNSLKIGDNSACRDKHGIIAKNMLKNAEILNTI